MASLDRRHSAPARCRAPLASESTLTRVPSPLRHALAVAAALCLVPGAASARAAAPNLAAAPSRPAAAPDLHPARLPLATAAISSSAQTHVLALVLVEGPTVLDLALAQDAASALVALDAEGASDRSGARAEAQRARTLAAAGAAVAERQAPVLAALQSAGIAPQSTYDTVLSGFLVRASPMALARIAAAPGVRSVQPAPRWTLDAPLGLPRAVPHVGASALAAAGGPTGAGVTVAIIDSGVDYTHRALGGTGDAGDYAANDEDVVEPGSFPNAKVVGGYDFAGAGYTGANSPSPDDDPLDAGGHGTHVAGIVAASGAGGPPGVARDARLVALKVFGRGGSTSLVTDALEWCVEARLGLPVPGTAARVDVVNLSLGAPWASALVPEIEAVRRVVAAGIVVVGSAGNSGDVAFIGGGPGSAPEALGVASSVGPGLMGDAVRAVWPDGAEDLEALNASTVLARAVPSGRPVRAPLAWLGRACPGDPDEGSVRDRVALIARGTCTFYQKLERAVAGGAVAAVVYDDGRGMATMGGDGPPLDLPAAMVGQADGQRLRAALEDQAIEVELSAAFAGTIERRSVVDTMSAFSSRGPSRSGVQKPDLAAPGTDIAAPAMGSGGGSRVLSGTSMAGPMVAGGAAVLLEALGDELWPALTALEVAGLLATSARTPVWADDNRTAATAPLARAGNGRLDLGAAVRSRTLASAGSAWRLAFGSWAVTETLEAERTASVRNLGDAERHYALSVAWADVADAGRGVGYAVAPDVLVVPPGASGLATVTLRAVADAMPEDPLSSGAAVLNGDARFHLAEWDARLEVVEVGAQGEPLPEGDVLRVPIGSLGRAASDVRPRALAAQAAGDGAAAFAFHAVGPRGGLVWPFQLAAEDGDEPRVADPYDVDLVGVRLVPSGGGRRVEFAVHTRRPRLAAYDGQAEVRIDLDGDGAADWTLDVDDASYRQTQAAAEPYWSGVLATLLTAPDGAWRALDPVRTRIDARWVVLGADASDLGFAAGDPIAFDFVVAHFARLSSGGYDTVPDGALQGATFRNPLSFDSRTAIALEPPGALAVAPGVDAVLAARWTEAARAADARVLAILPDALPRAGDAVVLSLGAGDWPGSVPTASATASITATAVATATGMPSPSPSETTRPEATATPTPSASPTPDASATATPDGTAQAVPPTPAATPMATPTLDAPATPAGTPSGATAPPPTAAPTDTTRAAPPARIYLPFGIVQRRRP